MEGETMESTIRIPSDELKEIVSILMESSFYLDMPLHERKSLIETLLAS